MEDIIIRMGWMLWRVPVDKIERLNNFNEEFPMYLMHRDYYDLVDIDVHFQRTRV